MNKHAKVIQVIKNNTRFYPVSPSLVPGGDVDAGERAKFIDEGFEFSDDATERPMVPILTLIFLAAGGSSPIFRLTDDGSDFFDGLTR